MKYDLTASAIPSEKVMTDTQFVASLSILDDILEANEIEANSAPTQNWEVVDSFETLYTIVMNEALTGAALEIYAKSTPGLSEIYGSSNEEFENNLRSIVASNEGVLDGLIGDSDTGPIGAIIAFARNNLPSVKEQIEICKKKLAQTSDQDIASRSEQKFIRVRSKYLPSTVVFSNGCAALTAALKAVAASPSADENKFIAPLKGSMFFNSEKKAKQGNQDTNWKYAGVRLLPSVAGTITGGALTTPVAIAERFWFEPSQPVGERGWNSRAAYQKGLTEIGTLVDALEAAVKKVASFNGEKDAAVLFLKWAEKEVVYLGRGLTTAIRKVYAGGFVRLVSNRVIH